MLGGGGLMLGGGSYARNEEGLMLGGGSYARRRGSYARRGSYIR